MVMKFSIYNSLFASCRLYKTLITVLVLTFLIVNNSNASVLDWQCFQTDNFSVYYPKGYDYQAREVLFYLEKYKQKIKNITGNKRKAKTNIVIQDHGLESNGYASALNNKVSIYATSPGTDFALSFNENWFRQVSIHEAIHIGQMTNSSGTYGRYCDLFGNLFSPNLYQPQWVVEGITVYGESQTSKFEGRLNDGYYDALIALKAKEDKLPDPQQANYYYESFPFGNFYFYGGTFFRFLSEKYGEEKFGEYFTEYGKGLYTFGIGALIPALGPDNIASKVYGKNIMQLFSEWKQYEKKKAAGWQIKGIPITNNRNITYLSGLTSFDNKLYYFKTDIMVNGPFQYSGLGKLIEHDPETGKQKIMGTELSSTIGLLQKSGNKLYMALKERQTGYKNIDSDGWGNTAVMLELDPIKNKRKKLFSDDFMDYAVLDQSRIIYVKEKKDKFGSEIWEFNNGQKKKLGETAELIAEIASWKDNLIVVNKKRVGSWDISYLSLANFKLTPIINSQWYEYKIKIIDDNLFFTGNYNKIVSSYQYNLKTKKCYKLTDSSFAEDGLILNNDLYFIGYNLNGQTLYKDSKIAKKKFTLIKPVNIPENEQELIIFKTEPVKKSAFYDNIVSGLIPFSRFIPALALGQDPMGLNFYAITYASSNGYSFSYTTKLLKPLTFSFESILNGTRKTYLNFSYPLFQASRKGLSRINLIYSTDLEKAKPGIALGFSLPRNQTSLAFMVDLQNKGNYSSFLSSFLLDNGSINMKLNLYNDFETRRLTRGYTVRTIENATGHDVSIELIQRTAKFRKGLWNPNIFIGDIYGSIFYDYMNYETTFTNSKNGFTTTGIESGSYSAYGAELLFETGLAFSVHIKTVIGAAVVQKNIESYFNVGFQL